MINNYLILVICSQVIVYMHVLLLAMDGSELLHGRPKGGVLVIYPDSFSRNTKIIQTHFPRKHWSSVTVP